MLAEDDDDVRRYLAETLRAANYTVIEAATGEKAIDVMDAYQGRIDLLLTDVVMPGMNGRKHTQKQPRRGGQK